MEPAWPANSFINSKQRSAVKAKRTGYPTFTAAAIYKPQHKVPRSVYRKNAVDDVKQKHENKITTTATTTERKTNKDSQRLQGTFSASERFSRNGIKKQTANVYNYYKLNVPSHVRITLFH